MICAFAAFYSHLKYLWFTSLWARGLPVTSCWRNEPGVSSNLLELKETGGKRKTDEGLKRHDHDVVFASVSPSEFVAQFECLTLTAGFTCLSRVTGAAAKGGLEVMDGLLEDLPFSALMTETAKVTPDQQHFKM